MTWQGIAALLVGAVVAVVGGLLNNQALVGLGSTIVGGALGVAVPRPVAIAPPVVPPPANGR